MRELGICGATRSKSTITTRPGKSSPRAPDLVKRRFRAGRPNELWVCDFTCVSTWSGFVYTALVIDVFSRKIVGWRTMASVTADLVTDAFDRLRHRRQRLLPLNRLVADPHPWSDLNFSGGFGVTNAEDVAICGLKNGTPFVLPASA